MSSDVSSLSFLTFLFLFYLFFFLKTFVDKTYLLLFYLHILPWETSKKKLRKMNGNGK